jgi:hypothetical protein
MAITSKSDFLSGLAVGLAISEGGGSAQSGRCPRAEQETLFDYVGWLRDTLTWTTTAEEYTE